MRLTHLVIGPSFKCDMLLYADDLEVLGAGRDGRIGSVLSFGLMAALGALVKWSKQRGGLVKECVSLTTDYGNYTMGLSEKRTAWMISWISSLRVRKQVSYRGFAAGIGRLGFAAAARGEAVPGPPFCLELSDTGQQR